MSLNGLDSPELIQAYIAAAAEPGTWFLLKYISRDTVDLLGQGSGGVSEARSCLAAYIEPSPLYGFLAFRRKRVLIKYIPPATSRLLQARTAVHFQSVTEALAPHDALLDITTADGLNDTALAASFPSYGTAGSVNLDEIAEDEEPGTTPTRQRQQSISSNTSKLSRKAALDRVTALRRSAIQTQKSSGAPTPSIRPAQTNAVASNALDDQSKSDSIGGSFPSLTHPQTSNGLDDTSTMRTNSGSTSHTEPNINNVSFDADQLAPRRQHQRQDSNTGSFRSSIAGVESLRASSEYGDGQYDYDIYDYKPKIKLAPRQVQIGERKRASQVPLSMRKARQSDQSTVPEIEPSRDASTTSQPAWLNEDPMAPVDSPMLISSRYVSMSDTVRSSNSSMYSRAPSTMSTRSRRDKSSMTPGQQRLLKAMEMRKQRTSRPQTPLINTAVAEEPASQADDAQNAHKTASEELSAIPSQSLSNDAPEKHEAGFDSGIEMAHVNGTSKVESSEQDSPIDDGSAPLDDAALVMDHEQNRRSVIITPAAALPEADFRPQTPEGQRPIDDTHTELLDTEDAASDPDDLALPIQQSPTSTRTRTESTTTNGEELSNMLASFPSPRSLEQTTPPQTRAGPDATDARPGSSTSFSVSIGTFLSDNVSPPISPPAKTWLSDKSDSRTATPTRSPARDQGLVVESTNTPVVNGSVAPSPLTADSDMYTSEYFNTATFYEATSVAVVRAPPRLMIPSPESSPASKHSSPVIKDAQSPKAPTLRTTPSRPGTAQSGSSPLSVDDLLPASGRNRIGSGISQRIAALAQSQSRELHSLSPPLTGLGSRRASNNTIESSSPVSPPSNISDFRGRLRSFGATATAKVQPRFSSPAKAASNSFYTIDNESDAQQEPVSVTAKIVRADPTATVSSLPEPLAAPVLLEPQISISSAPPAPVRDPSTHSVIQRSPAPSIHSVQSQSSAASSRFKRFSILSSDGTLAPPSPDKATSPSKSRTSRFFKRMSNLRKNTAKEPASPKTAGQTVQIGNVNVQFPQTPLWKRRYVEVSPAGNLLFSANEMSSFQSRNKASQNRAFDLKDATTVLIPRPDEQEMANSVILSFSDGGRVTMACEDGRGQTVLLELLQKQVAIWSH